MKRVFDMLVSAIGLLATWPLILVGAAAVKLTSRGPAFYRARRAGLHGQQFQMLKIRTMHLGSEGHGPKITAERDQRIHEVGRILRKFKIDELPQLWNVLRGDMSIVGPRPEDWDIVQTYYTDEQRRTLTVRPGIFSTVEVRWYPDLTYHDPPPHGIAIEEHYLKRHLPAQLEESLRYLERQNLLLDIKVIFQVLVCVLVYSWLSPRKNPLPQR